MPPDVAIDYEEMLAAIADKVSVIVADIISGQIYYASEKAASIFGYHMTGELKNKHVNVLMPEGVRDRHSVLRMHYADNPAARSMLGRSLAGQRRDGSVVNVSISIDPIVISGRPCAILTIVENNNANTAPAGTNPQA